MLNIVTHVSDVQPIFNRCRRPNISTYRLSRQLFFTVKSPLSPQAKIAANGDIRWQWYDPAGAHQTR